MRQVESVAAANGAERVNTVTIAIGALSGVEPGLLRQAFTIARAGTIAEEAALEIEEVAPRIYCPACDVTSDAPPNRLLCARCGTWQVRLVAGDELTLTSIALEFDDSSMLQEGSMTCAQPADAR